MTRLSTLLLVAAPLLCWPCVVHAADEDEKIVGVWERVSEKENLEETWVIKKVKDKWTVSGSFWRRDRNGEVGNFRGKDVKYADGTLTFTQDYFKLPKGRKSGTKVTASVEGDRLDFAAKDGDSETKDNMERAGDPSDFLGKWKALTFGMKELWVIEKDKKGALSVRGTFTKGDKEVGRWKGINVRYFARVLSFNQQFDKRPTKAWVNGVAIAGVARGGEIVFLWTNGPRKGKGKVTRAAEAP